MQVHNAARSQDSAMTHSSSRETEPEPNLSLKLTCAAVNFLCIVQGAINPIQPS